VAEDSRLTINDLRFTINDLRFTTAILADDLSLKSVQSVADTRFTNALLQRAGEFGIELSADTIPALGEYYALLSHWNDRLHLVAPCEPEEFVTRHVLESLLLLRFLPSGTSFVDVGSGAGLPAIPCLIAKPDLSATMIESSQKKSVFLREAAKQLGIGNRGTVIAKRFEDTKAPEVPFVTCRALDQFMTQLSTLFDWAEPSSTFLFFGGDALRQQLESQQNHYTEFLIPFSEKRFVFVVAAAPNTK
jgi:16S rRNA (guanine527-N7)-methyltransferase